MLLRSGVYYHPFSDKNNGYDIVVIQTAGAFRYGNRGETGRYPLTILALYAAGRHTIRLASLETLADITIGVTEGLAPRQGSLKYVFTVATNSLG
jgi:hypothetical protein